MIIAGGVAFYAIFTFPDEMRTVLADQLTQLVQSPFSTLKTTSLNA